MEVNFFFNSLSEITFQGCSKMSACKAPEVPRHEAYSWYVDCRGARETQQAGVFQQPVRKKAPLGSYPFQAGSFFCDRFRGNE
jgi:hypothetical protein